MFVEIHNRGRGPPSLLNDRLDRIQFGATHLLYHASPLKKFIAHPFPPAYRDSLRDSVDFVFLSYASNNWQALTSGDIHSIRFRAQLPGYISLVGEHSDIYTVR